MNEEQVGGVWGSGPEVLLILSGERMAESFKQVSANFSVRHVASAQVVVVECAPSELARLSSIPGVMVVRGAAPPPGLMESLTEGESLFVAAWLSRSNAAWAKQRPGEGLSWDAAGYIPPDPPADVSKPNQEDK